MRVVSSNFKNMDSCHLTRPPPQKILIAGKSFQIKNFLFYVTLFIVYFHLSFFL